jgi:two-component system OmpR family sensor kinase
VATFVGWIPVVLGCAWLLLRRLLEPLGGIAATAQRIRGGHFEERIDVARADEEIAGMAATLNEMLDRLDAVRVAQSRFNADVAHQLLNPVHAILLEADVALSRPRGAEELVASVERVGGLARRIESLCEALLTFSRTAVLDPARLQLVDLEPIVSDAVDQVTPSATARGIRIEAEGSAVVRGDAGLLHEAFVNLLANAVTHTPDGGGIEVVVDRLATGHRVRIIDHGGGVPAEVAEHLFERFQSATPGGGHGIGLALCRGILRSHGGDIVHEPTPGGGATFEVRFPDPATGP